MQASLQVRRFSVARVLIAFAVAAALLIGLQVGYALKATTVVTSPSRVVVVTSQPAQADDSKCYLVDRPTLC